MKYPKVLLNCPTYDKKSYCWQKWRDMIKSLSYPNFDVLFVDNSKDKKYFEEISKDFNVIHKHIEGDPRKVVSESRNILRDEFFKGDYDYFFSLEQDVFPPFDVIERLISHDKDIVPGV